MSQTQRNSTPLTCAWCTGSGKWAVSAGHVISCLVCGGKGQVMLAQPAGQCHQCAGTGRRGVANPCLTCSGTGWARVLGQG
jgi:DnaJ-class molecular chaperone